MSKIFCVENEESLNRLVKGWGDKEKDGEVVILEYGPGRGEARVPVAFIDRNYVFIPPDLPWLEEVHKQTILENLGLPTTRVG